MAKAASSDKECLLMVLELAVKYGIPAVAEMVRTWKLDKITTADVKLLAHRLKRPEEY